MYIKEDKQRKKRLVANHVIRSGTDIRALTILSAESGRRHTTFPFLFVRGGSTSPFNTTVSTMTVSSRKISTSQDGVGLPSTMRGSETEWRSSMVAVCWSDYVLWWQVRGGSQSSSEICGSARKRERRQVPSNRRRSKPPDDIFFM